MSKETFEANPKLLADYLRIGYMRHLEAERKSKMETIVKINQDYADKPYESTNAWCFNEALPRLTRELREIEKELDHISKADEAGHGFTAELSKLTFWEAEE